MARKKSAKDLPELEQLERIASLNKNEQIQLIRDLERSQATERAKRRDAERRFRQSETELRSTEASLTRMLDLEGAATYRKYAKAAKRKGKSQATAIVCANDWHVEQTIDSATVGGVNEFNLDIADKRISRLWEKAAYLIEFARKISNIDEVIVWAGGDLINGIIHEEFQQTNSIGVTQACDYVRDHLVSGIRYLAEKTKCSHLRFLANFGNHGRVHPHKRTHTAHSNSFEVGIYSNVIALIKADRDLAKMFSHEVAKGPILKADIQGWACRFNHGDNLKFHGGQAGITGPVNKAIANWNQVYDYAELDVIGHFHQFLTTPNFVACGCLCGYDPYAASINAKWQLPSQTLIVVDREYGKVITEPIFCEERPDAHHKRQSS